MPINVLRGESKQKQTTSHLSHKTCPRKDMHLKVDKQLQKQKDPDKKDNAIPQPILYLANKTATEFDSFPNLKKEKGIKHKTN